MKKNKSRYIANISLLVMAVGFITTLFFEETLYLKILQGGFEAGLVGGLADWFAVTALFRHPLGIPIPHTALLPKNREKITNTILSIVEKDWLKKESIVDKLSSFNIVEKMLSKAEEELEKEETKKQIKDLMIFLVQRIEKCELEKISKKALESLAHQVDTKEVLSFAIDKSIEGKYDEKFYDIVLQLVEKKLSNKETKDKITAYILQTMEEKSSNNIFKFALKPLMSIGKDKITSTLEKAIDDIMKDLNSKNSANRQNILQYIQKELQGVKENVSFIEQLEEKKNNYLDGKRFDEANAYIVDTLLSKINEMVHDETFFNEKVHPLLTNLLEKIKNNEEIKDKIESKIKDSLVRFVENNHSKIGALVRDNIDKLKNEQLVDMMENKIGKELSWIRVNGSFCGFLVGIGLTLIKISLS